ncbi:fumarylacetoacetate hydrolase family protein [Inmirania thermothiophila]|uniref:2-keto-4-pentenoate hydratase/2-oxohepta-3-ene-1,7-dioic acid hydratase in catechol pathway n=1 Tax=Inmirania thermothiophila TaxID=1750597 RepID=A0A3N1Y2Q9_9GAMM|nr:fumarylacetoacetate hydrolase family protein [Inmirania thermothiophila]ROR32798.1 2-keto-4-pentenoate hydratase/2-oxohepta-3-ene-1,7-dioic acid hydratase in catechol pathway [Inmirania thermothiophila]
MRIIRFRDPQGRIRYGEPAGEGRARVLAGEAPWALEPTGEEAEVARVLAPLAPVNIFGIGLNYRDHAAETGMPAPENPVLFMKPTTTVIGPGDAILLPAACEHGPEVDYEVELAVVIGRAARDVPAERALEHVLGYTVANDVSARRWQKHGGAGQWVRGKSFDTFCPLGPVLVTADELGDPQRLRLRTVRNGETLQDGSTADMIFGVRELVAFLSRDTTLLPGTVILTGTPAGVGFTRTPPIFLAPGDEITVEVEGIGALSNPVVAAGGG